MHSNRFLTIIVFFYIMSKSTINLKSNNSEMSNIIRKYAIINASHYGKAVSGTVLGAVVLMAKEKSIPLVTLKANVELIVKEVNKLNEQELKLAFAPFEDEVEQKKQKKAKETALPPMILKGVKPGEFIGRIPPEPSGYLHIGHAKQAILNAEFAKIYDGKVNLFIDDTNPAKEKQEYVDAIIRDIKWLGINCDKIYYASDNVEMIYGYAKKLIEKEKAYVCMCSQEDMKEKRMNGVGCRHRSQQINENIKLFEDMLNKKFNEGEAIVRYKGNMGAQNMVMRDPVIIRIIQTPHYRQGNKYVAWPLYDLSTPILDSINGITDIIRSKEFAMREELGKTLLGELGLRIPRMHQEARLNIKGNITQKRVITKLVTDKVIAGWDDPRLMTLMSLKRRGLQPKAIWDFVLKFGMSKNDGTVGLEMLMAENTPIIETIGKHLFFVKDPIPLEITNLFPIQVKLKLNPSSEKDFRKYTVSKKVYLSGDDVAKLKIGENVRLKEFADVKILTISKEGLTGEMLTQKVDLKQSSIIQWISADNFVECKIIVPNTLIDSTGEVCPNSLTTLTGYSEDYIKNLDEREVIQFERVGYVTLDKKEPLECIFITK